MTCAMFAAWLLVVVVGGRLSLAAECHGKVGLEGWALMQEYISPSKLYCVLPAFARCQA